MSGDHTTGRRATRRPPARILRAPLLACVLALAACGDEPVPASPAVTPADIEPWTVHAPNTVALDAPRPGLGDPQVGAEALRQYACIACHTIPGIVGPDPMAGPPLAGFAGRRYIAGVLPNTIDNFIRWVRAPQAVDPLTAMPDLGVTPDHARAMAAYLYSRP